MKKINLFFAQIKANFRELRQERKNKKNWSFLIIPFILIVFICMIVNEYGDNTNYFDLKTNIFTLITACIWIGVFNSIQSICNIRGRIKHQHLQGMSITAFVLGNVIYQTIICLIQTFIIMAVFCVGAEYNSSGIYFPIIIEYAIIIFLVLFSSDMLGMMISSFSKDGSFAMTLMPFVLVLQMVLSNALFDNLARVCDYLSYLMISRWGIDGFGVVSNIVSKIPNELPEYPKITFTYTTEHFRLVCVVLLLFAVSYIVIAIIRLKFIKNERLFN